MPWLELGIAYICIVILVVWLNFKLNDINYRKQSKEKLDKFRSRVDKRH